MALCANKMNRAWHVPGTNWGQDRVRTGSLSVNEINLPKQQEKVYNWFLNRGFKGRFNKSSESMTFKGNGAIRLKPSQFGEWDIYHINMPGLKI